MQAWIVVGKRLEKQKVSSLPKYLIAGSAAGMATTVFGCPSERIMTLAHIRKQGVYHVATEIGFKGMYQGWRVTLYRDIVFNAFFFTTRDMLVDLRIKYSSEHRCGKFERFLAGLPAGDSTHTHTHTHTHAHTHIQTHTYTHTCTHTYTYTYIHVHIYTHTHMYTFECYISCTISLGVLAASVSCPLDVVKTKVQGAKLGSQAAEESTLSVMKEIISSQGRRYLFKGLLPRIYVVPSIMLLFYVFDEAFKQKALDK